MCFCKRDWIVINTGHERYSFDTSISLYRDKTFEELKKELCIYNDDIIEQYKDEYTDEELKEIGRLKGILLAQYTKASVKSITSGVENAMKEAEGLVDGFLDGFFQ